MFVIRNRISYILCTEYKQCIVSSFDTVALILSHKVSTYFKIKTMDKRAF
jgi:hypothetical protein